MLYVGGLIVLITAIAVIKQYEVRLVLLVSGALMATLAGNPLGAVNSFTSQMTHGTLVPIICMVMGFAYVLKLTGCDAHLVHMLAQPMMKFNRILIPGTVIVTFLINIALSSAAGVSAAVGAILIPALTAAGVHPAMAASAVMAGTFGSTLNPGNPHNVTLMNLAEAGSMEVVAAMLPYAVTSVLIGAVTLTFVAFARKENTGYVPKEGEELVSKIEGGEAFEVNYLKAVVPVFPLALLIIGSSLVGIFENDVTVPQAMFAGIIVAFVVTLKNPQEISKAFFDGLGKAYGDVIGLVTSAFVFAAGMTAIGLTQALISAMQESEAIVNISAVFGPMLVATLAGSGDAATIAFNNTVTPSAALFGMEIMTLGNMANLGGALGRTMSPVAGATIVCAGLARINPMEIAKRNALGMLIAAGVMVAILTI